MGPIEKLIRALLDIRIVIERVGWDRSSGDALTYSLERAEEAIREAGFDPFASKPERR